MNIKDYFYYLLNFVDEKSVLDYQIKKTVSHSYVEELKGTVITYLLGYVVSYWERDHFSVWGDAQTGKLYYLNCYLLAPTESKAEYEQIFDNFISSMSDL